MITPPHRDFPIVDSAGIPDAYLMAPWMESISNLVSFLEIAEGNGSPEGVIFAEKKKLYFNNAGASGTLVYIKATDGTLNTGWVAIG